MGATMLDKPAAQDLLPAVAKLLRDITGEAPTPHAVFLSKVAANAVDLATREASLGPRIAAEERARLQQLFGETADLETLNRALAEALLSGARDGTDPAIRDHLWRTTLDKLSVDQPRYAAYQRHLKRTSGR